MRPDQLAWATVTPRKCRRHKWVTENPVWERTGPQAVKLIGGIARCSECGKVIDPAASRRGRNNRSRGNAIERVVCRMLGIKRVGQFGGLEDGGAADDWLKVQVKSGGAHSAGLLSKIHTIPINADQLRAWVTVSTPGAGQRREGVISFDLHEFAAWYGKGLPEVGE